MTHSLDLPSLVAAEAAWLHRLARGLLRDDFCAADLAQDTVALALTKRPDLGGSSRRARGWLRATAERLALAARREGRSRTNHEAAAAEAADCAERRSAMAELSSERLETHELLVSAVKSLHEPYRSTVVMRYFGDCPPREIARRKGLPAANVRQHLKRGMEILRHRLHVRMAERDRDWRSALVGFVLPGTFWKPLWLGSMTMGAKNVAVAGVIIACLCGGVYWSMTNPDPTPDVPTNAAAAPSVAETAASARGPVERERLNDTATADPTSAARETVFSVRDDAGRPIANTDIFVWQDSTPEHKRIRTDDTGTAQLGDFEGVGHALIAAPGMPPMVK
jgi:RNA polymerase sigma factor (sigma-70 family)